MTIEVEDYSGVKYLTYIDNMYYFQTQDKNLTWCSRGCSTNTLVIGGVVAKCFLLKW